MEQPKASHDTLSRYKLPTITLGAGVMASILVFALMLNISMAQLEREFMSSAALHSLRFKDSLQLNTDEMGRLAVFLSRETDSADEVFRALAMPLIKRNAFEKIFWVVPGDAAGALSLHSAVPRGKAAAQLPSALASSAEVLRALKTQKPVLVDISRLSDDTDSARVGLVFPIAGNGGAKGALIGLLNPARLLKQATSDGFGAADAEGYIFDKQGFDQQDGGQETLLYGHIDAFMARAFFSSHAPTSSMITRNAAFSYGETIPLLSRQWKIVFIPTAKYISGAHVLVPWLMMIACLALCGMVGIFLFYLVGRNTRIEEVVQDRTTELQQRSDELKALNAELREAKDGAERANATKDSFLANISHEMRTPLNSMIGLSELLLETELTPQQETHIRMILQSGENLIEIINNLLDFSKITSGKLELESFPFDLQTAVEDTAELFSPFTREKEQQLELLVHFTPGTPRHVVGDIVRLKQILSNLLNNAIKFTQAGNVVVTVEELKDADMPAPEGSAWIRISVCDSGIGIPQEKMKIIFDTFMQADSTTTRKFGGTGLGLSICRQLAQLMQGDVTAESAPGKGSIFYATVLLGVDSSVQELPLPPDYALLKGRKALIVDDSQPSRAILKAQLSGAGIECMETDHPRAGLAMLADAKNAHVPYDLLVIDYVLPEMNSVAYSSRAKALYPDMPVVMVTAMAEKGYSQIFASSGCDAYLTKPIRASQFLDILVMLFEARRVGKTLSMLTPLSVFRKGAHKKSGNDNEFIEGAEILLAEDNHANRDLVIKLLENLGCKATAVRDGEEAVDMVKKRTFDLILMDCQMPEMDGFEASRILRALKSRGEIPDTPIIALTANAMKGDREKCLESGMNDYITKPLRKTALRSAFMYWLPPKEKRRNKAQ